MVEFVVVGIGDRHIEAKPAKKFFRVRARSYDVSAQLTRQSAKRTTKAILMQYGIRMEYGSRTEDRALVCRRAINTFFAGADAIKAPDTHNVFAGNGQQF